MDKSFVVISPFALGIGSPWGSNFGLPKY